MSSITIDVVRTDTTVDAQLMLGLKGDKGDKGDAFTYADFTPDQLASLVGVTPDIQIGDVTELDEGETAFATITGSREEPLLNLGLPKGETGNGISSMVLEEDYTLTITYTDGTSESTAPIRGETGAAGNDGYSPTVEVETISGGHKVTITDIDGDHEFDVMDGEDSITDVRVAGSSVVSNNIADIPMANVNDWGVVKTSKPTISDEDYSYVKLTYKYASDVTSTNLATTSTATTSKRGLMSATDKSKLNGIASGAEVNVQSDWEEINVSSDAYIQNKPELAAVATSGDYADLSNTPALADVATSGSYDDLEDTPTIPEKVSDLENDVPYASMTSLESLMPTDTASGSVASFPDGQNVFPAKSVVAEINPIQDLHGYDKPWSGGSGKNKLNATPDIVKPLNTHGSWNGNVYTDNGVTFTVTDDGTITVNGTPTNTTYLELGNFSTGDNAYKINGFQGAYVNTATLTAIAGSTWYTVRDANGTEIPANTTARVCLYLATGASLTNAVFKPMIRLATETDATFAPYSNICPIIGWDEVKTEVVGKNLFDESNLSWTSGLRDDDGNIVSSQSHFTNAIYGLKPNTQYTVSGTLVTTGNFRIYFLEKDGTWISRTAQQTVAPYTFTAPLNCGAIQIQVVAAITSLDDVQLELGSTATAYEPYVGNTYTTDLDRTVYGGTVDLVSGVLTVDRAIVDLGTLAWTWQSSWYQTTISNMKYVSSNTEIGNAVAERYTIRQASGFSTADVGAMAIDTTNFKVKTSGYGITPTGKLVYELATPQTYQLDPQTVNTLKGQNNVWSDCGDTSVVYVADVQKYIEKKLS